MIKANVYSHGDQSVGINGYSAIVELDIDEFEDEDEREFISESLTTLFSNIWDDKIYIRFYTDEVQPYANGFEMVERDV